VLTLRTVLALAQLAAAEGHPAQAQTQLLAVVAGLRKLGAQSEANLAQALEALGEVQMAQGRAQPAIAAFQEAVALCAKSHDQTWELAKARERLGEAFELSGDNAAASAQLQLASQGLEQALGAEHPQTLRAKSALTQLRARQSTKT
jgi:tetratricopeptide (TPR) repeat protein